MKKFLFVTLILALIVALGSCNVENDSTTTTTTTTTTTNTSTPDDQPFEPPVEDHEHSYVAFATAPTCTEQGYTTYTCECEDSYVDDYVDATGHSYGEWVTVKDATATEEGLKERVCACGEKETEIIPLKYSEGLYFTLNDDGESYSLAGPGDCKDTDLVIPATYEGLPVTRIANDTFSWGSSYTSIIIPNTVTSIGDWAFHKCTSLTSITIPDSVTSIGDSAFKSCTSLVSINIPDSVTSIGPSAFASCFVLTSIDIPDSVTVIGEAVFSNCTSLKSVTLPKSVTNIDTWAFYYCSNLKSIIIPSTVTNIGSYAFFGCTSLKSITFEGTVELWNDITKGSNLFSYVLATEVVCTNGKVTLE